MIVQSDLLSTNYLPPDVESQEINIYL